VFLEERECVLQSGGTVIGESMKHDHRLSIGRLLRRRIVRYRYSVLLLSAVVKKSPTGRSAMGCTGYPPEIGVARPFGIGLAVLIDRCARRVKGSRFYLSGARTAVRPGRG
jgi:hypothetical protein